MIFIVEARADIATQFGRLGIRVVQREEHDTQLNGVETLADARKCAEWFCWHMAEFKQTRAEFAAAEARLKEVA